MHKYIPLKEKPDLCVTDVWLVTATSLEEIAFFIAMCVTSVSTFIFFDVLLFTFSAKQNIFVVFGIFFFFFLERFTVPFKMTAEATFSFLHATGKLSSPCFCLGCYLFNKKKEEKVI